MAVTVLRVKRKATAPAPGDLGRFWDGQGLISASSDVAVTLGRSAVVDGVPEPQKKRQTLESALAGLKVDLEPQRLGHRLQNFRLATTLGAIDSQSLAVPDLLKHLQPTENSARCVQTLG